MLTGISSWWVILPAVLFIGCCCCCSTFCLFLEQILVGLVNKPGHTKNHFINDTFKVIYITFSMLLYKKWLTYRKSFSPLFILKIIKILISLIWDCYYIYIFLAYFKKRPPDIFFLYSIQQFSSMLPHPLKGHGHEIFNHFFACEQAKRFRELFRFHEDIRLKRSKIACPAVRVFNDYANTQNFHIISPPHLITFLFT